MDQNYRDATTRMEERGVQLDYIIGWQTAYLGHTEREEQLRNEAYEAGRTAGKANTLDDIEDWVGSIDPV
ncbi:MAG: hypothetical protein IIB69_04290 [Proteobacteria bacterium]|nr:hypothetical protein [Pseudomonadota bacterium]MCH8105624.1 hypothetical protein [Pseudomonadota bacterium]